MPPKVPEGPGSPKKEISKDARLVERLQEQFKIQGRPIPDTLKKKILSFVERMQSDGIADSVIEKEVENQVFLVMESYYDQRFKLPNNSYFRLEVDDVLTQTKPEEADRVALMTFDLNGLKAVNDIAGHQAGDEYLKRVAAIFKGGRTEIVEEGAAQGFVVESTITEDLEEKGYDVFVASCGGDEFSIIIRAMDPKLPPISADFRDKILSSYQQEIHNIDCTDLVTPEQIKETFKEDIQNLATHGVVMNDEYSYAFKATIAGGGVTLREARDNAQSVETNPKDTPHRQQFDAFLKLADRAAKINKDEFKERIAKGSASEQLLSAILARNPQVREYQEQVRVLEHEKAITQMEAIVYKMQLDKCLGGK